MIYSILDSPCIFCGYCGAGYYQSGTHSPNCPWHGVGGLASREGTLRGVVKSVLARLKEAEGEIEMRMVKCEDCSATQNFIGQGLYECWKCTEAETREILKKAEARAERYKAALEDIADYKYRCMDKNCEANDVARAALRAEEGEK